MPKGCSDFYLNHKPFKYEGIFQWNLSVMFSQQRTGNDKANNDFGMINKIQDMRT